MAESTRFNLGTVMEAYKCKFSKSGGLLFHNGCRVFYRPEGDKKAQLLYLKDHGLDSKMYVALVMNDEYAAVWKTRSQAEESEHHSGPA